MDDTKLKLSTLKLLVELAESWATTITTEEDGSATVTVVSRRPHHGHLQHTYKRESLSAAISAAYGGEPSDGQPSSTYCRPADRWNLED